MTTTHTPAMIDDVTVVVLRGLCRGLTDREIAREAHVSPRTVQRLVDQFKATSESPTRFAAGVAAWRLGLLGSD